jgi:hypothetical protein
MSLSDTKLRSLKAKDKPYKVADGDGLFAQVAASGSVLWRWLGHIFADDGYAGPKLRGGLDRIGEWTIEIVKRTSANAGFAEGLVLAERGGRGAPRRREGELPSALHTRSVCKAERRSSWTNLHQPLTALSSMPSSPAASGPACGWGNKRSQRCSASPERPFGRL